MRNSLSDVNMLYLFKIAFFFLLQSKKESRKLAYDVLLATSINLRNSESNSADSDLQRLFTMVAYIKYYILNIFPFVLFGFENVVLSHSYLLFPVISYFR